MKKIVFLALLLNPVGLKTYAAPPDFELTQSVKLSGNISFADSPQRQILAVHPQNAS